MELANVSLDDKYTRRSGRIFLSGIQALARLPIVQRLRDRQAGLDTAGFIFGYRGSPLGGLDQELWRARQHLEAHHIHFGVPVVVSYPVRVGRHGNADLAGTEALGSQLEANRFRD